MEKFLEGKTVLVTGGGGGIGWGICLECARAGAKLIVTDIDRKKGGEVLDDLEEISSGHRFWYLDVRNTKENCRGITNIYEAGGRIDVLINNAGVNSSHGFLDMAEDAWDEVFAVNLRGHFFLSQIVARKMIEHKARGVILFTTSVHQEIIQGRPHYSTSKAALRMLIREMAVELAPHGIRVNGVAPGGIDLRRIEDPALAGDEPTVLLGGKNGIPSDIGRMMVVLASDWSRHMTGEVVTVSGGQYLLPFVRGK